MEKGRVGRDLAHRIAVGIERLGGVRLRVPGLGSWRSRARSRCGRTRLAAAATSAARRPRPGSIVQAYDALPVLPDASVIETEKACGPFDRFE
jgi:hypothetical protein